MKRGQKIVDGAESYLEPGEQVLIGLIAQARGAAMARPGGAPIAGGNGAQEAAGRAAGAEDAGRVVPSPVGVALTDRRLLTLAISTPWGPGLGGKVTELLSAVPLGDVESIEVRQLAFGRRVTLTVGGTEFEFELGAGADADDLADAL